MMTRVRTIADINVFIPVPPHQEAVVCWRGRPTSSTRHIPRDHHRGGAVRLHESVTHLIPLRWAANAMKPATKRPVSSIPARHHPPHGQVGVRAGSRPAAKEKLLAIYDPACGLGGMLTIAKEHLLGAVNPSLDVYLYGQEINEKTYAICKADMLMKGEDP